MGKALIIKGADFSQVAVDTIDIVVAPPTISIDLFGNVTIDSPNGEEIYYTTDNSTPTNQSTKYTAGFNVALNTTVKAVCYLGGNYSDVASKKHDGTLPAPTISITPRGVVTITATNNATIRYTTDGQTNPTSSTGTLYNGQFTVADGVEVRAIAFLESGGTTITSTVASVRAEVEEGIHLNKYLAGSESLEELTDETEYHRCVSPYIDAYDGNENMQANLIKVMYRPYASPDRTYFCVTTPDKQECINYWGAQSGLRALEGASYGDTKFGRYWKGTFKMGTAGYIEVYHRVDTSSAYVLVAKWEYNGGETDATATWTRTVPAQS